MRQGGFEPLGRARPDAPPLPGSRCCACAAPTAHRPPPCVRDAPCGRDGGGLIREVSACPHPTGRPGRPGLPQLASRNGPRSPHQNLRENLYRPPAVPKTLVHTAPHPPRSPIGSEVRPVPSRVLVGLGKAVLGGARRPLRVPIGSRVWPAPSLNSHWLSRAAVCGGGNKGRLLAVTGSRGAPLRPRALVSARPAPDEV